MDGRRRDAFETDTHLLVKYPKIHGTKEDGTFMSNAFEQEYEAKVQIQIIFGLKRFNI